jgi:hemolysin activation/secretion protein
VVLPAEPSLQRVRFDGNREIATAELRAAAQRLGARLGDDDGPALLALAVTEVYFDNGYLTVGVAEPVRARDGALVVHVIEGARFRVRAIAFSGAWPRAGAELRASLRTRAGEIFSRARIMTDVASLAASVDGTVTPLTQIDVEHHLVDVELALQR